MTQKKRDSIPIYTSVDQFYNLRELSRRSNSNVFEASCRATGISVAIKRFKKDSLSAKEAVHVAREVHLMGMLRGEPGVVQIYGFFEDENYVYIVMEYCSGRDVYQLLVARQRIDQPLAASSILAPLLQTLHMLHTRHAIVHRDIKPENILLTADGEVRLADFGAAIKQDVEVPFLPVGTLDFMAPEVLSNPTPKGAVESPCTTPDMLIDAGLKPYDHKADVWSVGALAYELIIGQPPFYHEDAEETRNSILGSSYLYFPKHMQGTAFAHFVCSALTRNPEYRPSADDLLNHEWIRQYFRPALYADRGDEDAKQQCDIVNVHVDATVPSSSSLNTARIDLRAKLHPNHLSGNKHLYPSDSSTASSSSSALEETLAAMAMVQVKDASIPTIETDISRNASVNGVLYAHAMISDDSGDAERPPRKIFRLLRLSTSSADGIENIASSSSYQISRQGSRTWLKKFSIRRGD